jgi:hypothetical protein
METSLHRQLKEVYAGPDDQLEVRVDGFRIDVVSGGQLVEIQHGPLAAIRDKVRRLLDKHRVLVVKPIVARRHLVKQNRQGGRVVQRRQSPKHGTIVDLFGELVHFTNVFPHPNLVLEVPLVEVEEWRYPGHGRRRRRRARDHQTEDQKLMEIQQVHRFRTAADLRRLIPRKLPSPFHTLQLAQAMDIQRWVAQQIAYCLRQTGTITQVGKQGNSLLYELTDQKNQKVA